MKLTRASSYALHAVMHMANQEKQKPIPSHLIARAQGIPERFLVKVLRPLVSARLLLSLPGPNGGYCLAKSANKVSILEILEAVDGPIRGQVPFTSSEEEGNGLDERLEALCNEVADHSRRRLQKVHVSDLLPSNGH
ncbi:MAG: Rrf2 family transcriptional regulator [Planctomycetes bacterium]|nr:Rrf2 family transcriptional regulator [Planctomycetota bacterium]